MTRSDELMEKHGCEICGEFAPFGFFDPRASRANRQYHFFCWVHRRDGEAWLATITEKGR